MAATIAFPADHPPLGAVARHLATRIVGDARHYQILALGILLMLNIVRLDFGAALLPSLLAITSALTTQTVCSRLWRLPHVDLRSALITGLSLSLLLRADTPWLSGLAGIIAIASKFILRVDGKHVWNPAGFAIVMLLLGSSRVWISPGQWGASLWFAALLGLLATLVLQAARRSDIALFFLVCHAALLIARALWLGDPLAIPLHQLESGSLLLFVFFMITDPRTTPASRIGRLLLAIAVACLAYGLAFRLQIRPALYVALFALSPLTPVIDRFLPAGRFAWASPRLEGASR